MSDLLFAGAIFDMGGVLAHDVWEHLLLDPERGICTQFSLDRDQVERVGELLWQRFAYLPETGGTNWQVLEQLYWQRFIDCFPQQLSSVTSPSDFINLTEDFISPVEGMIPILERLQSHGIDLAMCSNNNEFWFRRQMNKLGLHGFFSPSKVVLSCRIGVSKSSPGFEMYQAAANALAIPKTQCLFVDDREGNIERARVVGMHGILFTSAQALAISLSEVGL